MEPMNEPSPADGDRKLEQQTHENFDKAYQDLLSKEQEAMESKLRGEATQKFDEVRQLGFATATDVDKKIGVIFGKFFSEMEKMRDENTKLREWVMRARMQGLNSGAGDEKKKEPSVLDKYRRPFS
jgi:hypothetical protein